MVLDARGVPRRKGPGGRWEVMVDGRWSPEEGDMRSTGPVLPPANPSGEIRRRFELVTPVDPDPTLEEEGPAMATTRRPERRAPTARETEAWRLCAPPPEGQGMYWADAAPILGLDVSNTVRLVRRYMEVMGITGEAPGRLPEVERLRRARAARAARQTGPASEAPAIATTVSPAPPAGTEEASAAAPVIHARLSDPEPEPDLVGGTTAIEPTAPRLDIVPVLAAELARVRAEHAAAVDLSVSLTKAIVHLEDTLAWFSRAGGRP